MRAQGWSKGKRPMGYINYAGHNKACWEETFSSPQQVWLCIEGFSLQGSVVDSFPVGPPASTLKENIKCNAGIKNTWGTKSSKEPKMKFYIVTIFHCYELLCKDNV